jgi:hypothetical protein
MSDHIMIGAWLVMAVALELGLRGIAAGIVGAGALYLLGRFAWLVWLSLREAHRALMRRRGEASSRT